MAVGKTRTKHTKAFANCDSAEQGLVVVNYGAMLDVEDAQGNVVRCVARNNVGGAVCGDRVLWQRGEHNDGTVLERLTRHSLLARSDARGQSRAIAANVDQLIIVVTAMQNSSNVETDLLDRYLACAELNNMAAVLVINKTDLIHEGGIKALEDQLAIYRKIGYTSLFVSAASKLGLEELSQQLAGKTNVFVGQSGMGKSSLIKHFLPSEDIRTAAVSVGTGLGKHTTTRTILYHLPNGGHLIDSPGVREFGLGVIPPIELMRGFKEFKPFLGQCRFNDCIHQREPGCALEEAVAKGLIETRRLQSYRAIANAMLSDIQY